MVTYATQKQETLAPVHGAQAPIPDEARKPRPAIQGALEGDFETPELYSPISNGDQEEGTNNPSHVRAGDDKVIISQSATESYNSTGSYLNDAATANKCCTICPKGEDCEGAGCYSKCHKFCGEQCNIGKAGNGCTIGVDCGVVGGDQDMVNGYEKMKAPAGLDSKTPDAPLKDEARYPLPERDEDKKLNEGIDISVDIAPEPSGDDGSSAEEEEEAKNLR